ncbi:MAG: biotin--[acetyl-CoA-carboxylase] ligase [Muribaculaceae bacterium]|nr:biotin--[acetyl-CoA-carboxylase] ligase [Muribaculaceae bacterium]
MIIELPEVDSTNNYAKLHSEMRAGDVVVAHRQTGGRGQRGNSWEAEPGKNLTFSVVVEPRELRAVDQFQLSMAVALAVRNALAPLLPDSDSLCVKWPNDIYHRNRKLGGILIENSLRASMIARSIIGVGINVNQIVFRNAGPNPVSMAMLTGRETPLRPLLERLSEAIKGVVDMVAEPAGLRSAYLRHLWRRNGIYGWRLPDGTRLSASIAGVTPEGYLLLQDAADGNVTAYNLKEVFADIAVAAEPPL